MTDTLYADVSEWQAPVNDSYPHRVLCIRSNDGTYRDRNWWQNLNWCEAACDSGRLEFFIVYFVWRPNWQETVDALKANVGVPHSRMAVMIDVESWGGQISGDQSDGINKAYWAIADWLGDKRRVIGYGNTYDLNTLWRTKPDGIRLVVAGYGQQPDYPGMVAHQYTDGQGYGGGLPEGAPPFGNCDMNAANGLDPAGFAAACGIGTTSSPTPGGPLMALSDAEQRELLDKTRAIHAALCAPRPSLIKPTDGAPPAQFDLPTFVQCADAATYRTERTVAEIAKKLGVTA
ncbi:hypothetical protein [Speluncibacter jeojiensis]|uniref:hypothetical protein n=1 Tax=Speluncibacter jeojiensis TaxID=2710754 RepID=UPI002410572B|nr:hypothetical protein [Rhodococcus sp. D2-41]